MSNKFFVTTPIYYVNDVPHIGHAYTTIIADVLANRARLEGKKTLFLTGTDEHGQKIEEAAKHRGKNPKEYADEISGAFASLWRDFDISNDIFIRTTDEKHKRGVEKAFELMHQNGDIYKGEFEGHYCISCETFFTETQLNDNDTCPDCGKATELIKEENYFFRLSKYQDKLLDWYKSNENLIYPKSRKNEVIRFVEGGLEDLSITRTSFEWGIKIPSSLNDEKHVIYVWLDALMNYLTALGYGSDEANMQFWSPDVQLIGKDILRFHAIYWPAFLMSLNLPLPKSLGVHGWWTRDGAKMSKSRGNVINPKEIASAYGLDNFRYFLLREVPFGQDGDFSQKSLIDRINSDLGNDLGNLLNRLVGMSEKYFDNKIEIEKFAIFDQGEVNEIVKKVKSHFETMSFSRFLEELWRVLYIGNKAINDFKPWEKMKAGEADQVQELLVFVANLLAKVALELNAIMPEKTAKIASSLGIDIDKKSFDQLISGEEWITKFALTKCEPLFPRVETPLIEESPLMVIESEISDKKPAVKQETVEEESLITIDQFFATTIKVGTVVEANEVPKSKKLILLKVDLGEANHRQIVAGIREFYEPANLVGTQVCVVANLKPAKLMGYESQGMVLAAKDSTGLKLICPESQRENGTKIS